MLARGALDDAVRGYEQLRGDGRYGASAALRLSLIAGQRGDFRREVAEAIDALGLSPPDPDALELVAKRLLSLGEKQHALEAVRRLLSLRPVRLATLAELGKMLSDADEPAAALQLLERARRGGLSSSALHYLIGLSEMYMGNKERALENLEASLRMDPMFAHAHWALVKLSRQDEGGKYRDRLISAIGRLEEGRRGLPLLLYALFHRLDAEGDTVGAWQALSRGMAARRRQVRYDPAAEARMFRQLEKAEGIPDSEMTSASTPIFVVGLPRTGTTLLDQLLGRHPDVACAGELRDFNWSLRWIANLGGAPLLDERLVAAVAGGPVEGLGSRYLARTASRAGGKAFYTDKLPQNFMNIGWIAGSLPQARIVHLVRDPMDACFSNLKELFAAPYAYSYDQRETAGHFVRYRQLMSHWHQRFPGRILDVRYEELVSDPEGTVRRVAAHCGLDASATSGATPANQVVATASAMQVREPIHQRGIGAWSRYAGQLAPLQQELDSAGLLR